MITIQDLYHMHTVVRKGDMGKHIPTLMRLGESVDHITEFGVRSGVSTLAWLMSKPKTLRCYDLAKNRRLHLNLYKSYAKDNNVDFSFEIANDLEIEIEPTELLFIDTSHTYEHTLRELELHGKKVSKLIVLHDTMGKDGKVVIPAIGKYLYDTKAWLIDEHHKKSFGLTVLRRHQWEVDQ